MGKYFKERRESLKKKILYSLIVVAVFLLGYIIIKVNNEKIVVDEIEHRIVFICKSNSYGDTYEDRGFVIDNCGDKYYYDLSNQREFYYKDMNYEYEYLNKHFEEYEKEPFLEKDQLYKAYNIYS